jgi:hypothetical protein
VTLQHFNVSENILARFPECSELSALDFWISWRDEHAEPTPGTLAMTPHSADSGDHLGSALATMALNPRSEISDVSACPVASGSSEGRSLPEPRRRVRELKATKELQNYKTNG